MGIPLLGCMALSDRFDADFHGAMNFAFTEFSEVQTSLICVMCSVGDSC
jgi:hypothetical protein